MPAPKRDGPPRRFNELKTPPPASQEPVTDAFHTFTIFHGLVRTIPVHARFVHYPGNRFFFAGNGEAQVPLLLDLQKFVLYRLIREALPSALLFYGVER